MTPRLLPDASAQTCRSNASSRNMMNRQYMPLTTWAVSSRVGSPDAFGFHQTLSIQGRWTYASVRELHSSWKTKNLECSKYLKSAFQIYELPLGLMNSRTTRRTRPSAYSQPPGRISWRNGSSGATTSAAKVLRLKVSSQSAKPFAQTAMAEKQLKSNAEKPDKKKFS